MSRIISVPLIARPAPAFVRHIESIRRRPSSSRAAAEMRRRLVGPSRVMSPGLLNPFRFAAGGGSGGLASPVTITIDHTKCGSADTTNFVMLFSSTDNSFRSVANGGSVGTVNDFRFAADSAGVTLYNWEIVSWDAVAGTLVARVKVPTLSHTSDTELYLLYDNTGRGSFLGGSAGSVWDANYKGSWGWGDGSTLAVSDLTTNANNGTNHNAAVAASGPNGLGGISFTAASTNYVTTANTLNLAHVTEEILMKFSNPGGTPAWSLCGITQGNGGGTNDKEIGFTLSAGNATLSWYVFPGGVLTATAALSPDVWHHVAAVADGTNQILYVDGVSVASQAAGDTFTGYTAPGFQVCGNLKASTFQYGTFVASDTRISGVGRSASCILATSNSFLSPSTFYTLS